MVLFLFLFFPGARILLILCGAKVDLLKVCFPARPWSEAAISAENVTKRKEIGAACSEMRQGNVFISAVIDFFMTNFTGDGSC